MMTATQITDALRAAPMPLHVKEQILDQVLGYHDGLHTAKSASGAKKPIEAKRPMPKTERVAEARRIGGFLLREVLPSGDVVYDYCKEGSPAYEVVVREERPVYCSCPDFRFHVSRDPDYDCKHLLLFSQQEEADAVIAECARLAAAWETAWAWHKLGRLTDEECSAAYASLESARAKMQRLVTP